MRGSNFEGDIMEYGTVTFVSNKGWFFAKCDIEDIGVFIPQKNIEHRRYLRLHDRISFNKIPSTTNPNDLEATDVKFVSHGVSSTGEAL